MNLNKSYGFTLIELMIAVVVMSILVAIALPSYQEQIRKTRRSDAQNALTTRAALQERWFTVNNSYTNAIANLNGVNSDEGYYTIAVAIPAAAECTVGARFYCYTLTATAVGAQLADTNCRTLSIDHTGAKTSMDSTPAASTGCW